MSEEFSFLTSRTRADWEEWIRRNVRVSDDGVTLATEPTVTASRLGFEAVDFDVNPNGNLAVVLPSGTVSVYASGAGELKRLSLAGTDESGVERPAAVGTTNERIYVFDDDRPRVAAYSRRWRDLVETADLDVNPVAVVGSQQRVYVLDTSGSDRPAVHTLSADERSRTLREGLGTPVDISVGPDETMYVLDHDDATPSVSRVDVDAGRFSAEPSRVDLSLPDGFTPWSVSAQTVETLFLAGNDADGRSGVVEWEMATGTVEQYETPDRKWATLVSGTVGTSGHDERVYLQSPSGESWKLTKTSVNRKDPETTRYEGRLTRRLDSGEQDTQWHRTKLDVDQLGPDSRVDVAYYTSDGSTEGIDDFGEVGVTAEQAAELRAVGIDGLYDLANTTPETVGNVLPTTTAEETETWVERARTLVEREFERRDDVRDAHGPTDMLLREATGRYLHLSVRLVGRRDAAPTLRSLTTYCPRRSYVRYLPDIYREESDDSSFLARFLSLFESVFVDMEAEIERRGKYFDPEQIPADSLSWLNEWLAVEQGEEWPETARREYLARAPELYKQRGTRRGLEAAVGLYLDHVDLPERDWAASLVRIERRLESLVDRGFLSTDEAVRDIEDYRERSESPSATDVYFLEHGQLTDVSDPDKRDAFERLVGQPRRFQVLVHPSVSEAHLTDIEEIIQSHKPVYTDCGVTRLDERYRLGENTYLGINSACPVREFQVGETVLGAETRLRPDD